jgi:enoyl-[acyl-carrier protein] reductase II
MERTNFCKLFGVEVPILQAAIWPATTPELVAAVSNAGGLGSIGAVFESAETLAQQITRVRELTNQPFVVNHVIPLLNEEAFAVTLDAQPAAISLALGEPGNLPHRAHSIGAKVIHQVHTVAQAERAAACGVDVIIAQGSEAGGQGLSQGVSTMVLVPQVVDAVAPTPVLAAGGVADGRGLAAALMLGADGVNIGTRFLATYEAGAAETWKQALLASQSEQVVRFEVWNDIFPSPGGTAYPTVPRVLPSSFVDQWLENREEAKQQAPRIREQILAAVAERRPESLLPFAGQTAGLIHEILPAGEVVRRIITEAEQALRRFL